MKMKKGLFAILAFVNLCFSINAQVRFHSLQDVLDFAGTHAIGIQNSEKQEELLALKTKESKTNLLPTISANIAYNDNITLQPVLIPEDVFNPSAPDGSFREITFGTKYNYYIGGRAQWEVLNFQKLFALKTAEADWQKGKVSTSINKMNTYNTLANTYYSILLTQEAIRIYKENISATQTIYTSAQNKYQKGIISEADLNMAEIRKIKAESSLHNAANNLNQLFAQLQSQLNITDFIQIDDNLSTFLVDEKIIASTHPEVLLKEAEIQKQENIIKQAKALRYPVFSLSYQNSITWAGQQFFNFSNVNELPNQIFGANLSIPIGNFPTKQKIKESKLELEMKQSDLENTKLVKDKEDELLKLRLDQANEQFNLNKKILHLQSTNDKHSENKYQKEVIGLDERLNQYEDLLTVQDAYLQSLGALTIAKYQLYIRKLNYN